MITVNARYARIPARAARANLSQTDWKVLHAIGLHADKDARAFPSMARIAQIAEIKRNNVPRAIKRIVEAGLMRRQRTPRPTGGWQATHYRLIFEPIGDVISADDTQAENVVRPNDA